LASCCLRRRPNAISALPIQADEAGDRHWFRVAVETARRTGYVIEERAANRYAPAREQEALGLAPAPIPEVVRRLADIAKAVHDIAR
jgi:hypothetical protein